MFKEFKIAGDLTIFINENCVTHIHPRGDDLCEIFFTSGESQFIAMSQDEIRNQLGMPKKK